MISLNGTETHRALAIGWVFFAVGIGTWRSISDPRGTIRRASAGYVARLDMAQRAMFVNPAGAKIAWTQLMVVVALLVIFGLTDTAPLLAVSVLVIVLPPALIARQVSVRRARID